MRTSRFAPVIAALCMLQLSCCKENEPQPQPKKSKSTHSFYVDNRLSEDIEVFSTVVWGAMCMELSEDYLLNTYHDLGVAAQEKLLVRYYDNSKFKDSEALNAFDYDRVLQATRNSFIEFQIVYKGRKSKDLWSGEYWDYYQKDKWNAEYTLVVDRKLIDELFD